MGETRHSWMIAAVTSLSFLFTGAFVYASGLIHVNLQARFNSSHTKTAWAGALFISNFSLAGPLASILLRRFNCRITMILSGVLLCTGFLLTGLATSIDQCIVTLGFIAGLGGGIHATVGWTVLGYHFKRRLSIASGMAGMAIGLGTLCLSYLMREMMDYYGHTGCFFILAGIGLQNVVVGALYRPSETESSSKLRLRINYVNESAKVNQKITIYVTIKDYCSTCTSLPVLCMSFSLFFHAFGTFIVYYFLPSYCLETGSTQEQLSWVMSANGIGSFTGRGLLGFASASGDVDELLAYFSCIGLSGIATLFFPIVAHTFLGQIVFSTILGIYTGCIYSILGRLLIQLVGVEKHSHGFGALFFLFGVGTLLGPTFTAFLADSGGGFVLSFLIAGVCNIIAALSAMIVPVLRGKSPSLNTDVVQEITKPTVEAPREELAALMVPG